MPRKYWRVTIGDEKELGINGYLSRKGETVIPTVNTISLSSVDKFSNLIQNKDGKMLMPKTAIPGVGWMVLNVSGYLRQYLWNNRRK